MQLQIHSKQIRACIICCIIFIAISISFSFGQTTALKLIAAIKNKEVKNQDDLVISLTLINESGKPLFIHKHIAFNYLSSCDGEDYCFEAAQKINSQFVKIKPIAAIDNRPGYDSTGLPWSDIYDTIQPGEKSLQAFNLNGFYSFDKGLYKVRFGYQPSVNNGEAFKQVYSNWIYFAVKASHVNFHL